jgi:hypothetical protein
MLEQPAKGPQVYPVRHRHIGAFFTATHVVCGPHAPRQGPLHRSPRYAKLLGHSALMVHSG